MPRRWTVPNCPTKSAKLHSPTQPWQGPNLPTQGLAMEHLLELRWTKRGPFLAGKQNPSSCPTHTFTSWREQQPPELHCAVSIPQCCKGSPRALGSNGESKIQRCCSSTCVRLEPEASGQLSLLQSLIARTEPGRPSDTSISLLLSCHPPVKPQITHLFCS